MKTKKQQEIHFLEFELLQAFPELRHATFLNLPMGEEDPPHHPLRALDLLGVERGVKLGQKHGDLLLEVKEVGEGCAHFEGYDGMVTQEEGTLLLIRHADCQPALFYDPHHHALAAVHCGWRGSVLNIYGKTVEKMRKLYGTQPEELIVCVGPSLGPDHAEFKEYREMLPTHFWPFQTTPNHFDFWEISRIQLLEAGILKEHMEFAKICTYACNRHYFSYRRDRALSRHGTCAALLSV